MDDAMRAGVLRLLNDVAQSEHRLRHLNAFDAIVSEMGFAVRHGAESVVYLSEAEAVEAEQSAAKAAADREAARQAAIDARDAQLAAAAEPAPEKPAKSKRTK